MNNDIYLAVEAVTKAYQECNYWFKPIIKKSTYKNRNGLAVRWFTDANLRFITYKEFLIELKELFKLNAEVLLTSELKERFYDHIKPANVR